MGKIILETEKGPVHLEFEDDETEKLFILYINDMIDMEWEELFKVENGKLKLNYERGSEGEEDREESPQGEG